MIPPQPRVRFLRSLYVKKAYVRSNFFSISARSLGRMIQPEKRRRDITESSTLPYTGHPEKRTSSRANDVV